MYYDGNKLSIAIQLPPLNPERRGCQSRAHAPKPGDHGSTNYPNMTGPTAWKNPHPTPKRAPKQAQVVKVGVDVLSDLEPKASFGTRLGFKQRKIDATRHLSQH